jgi:hypothetical protein
MITSTEIFATVVSIVLLIAATWLEPRWNAYRMRHRPNRPCPHCRARAREHARRDAIAQASRPVAERGRTTANGHG